MTAPLRLLAALAAADWLSGDPAAADRAAELAEYATDSGQVAELVAALLNSVGVAVGGDLGAARRRLDHHALDTADVLLDAAVAEGRYRSREER